MVSYKKLWKLLIDKDMTKKDLASKAGLSTYTMTKMHKGDVVKSDTLAKICKALDCTFDDIMEIVEGE
jgi:DNA-binding Xre family transcriptional regulator